MEISKTYFPHEIFRPTANSKNSLPRVFIAPQRYIQGNGILDDIGRYLTLLKAKQVAVLISARGQKNEGERLLKSLSGAEITPLFRIFKGECSLNEIEKQAQSLAGESIDCVIAIGGGKCVDTGKAVAFRLGVPVVIVPTLASNDAPCSALSVLYTDEGVSNDVEF